MCSVMSCADDSLSGLSKTNSNHTNYFKQNGMSEGLEQICLAFAGADDNVAPLASCFILFYFVFFEKTFFSLNIGLVFNKRQTT